MAGEANAAEFEGAAYTSNYRAARGLDPSDRVTGGIFMPKPEKIRPGSTIFRFGDTGKALDADRYGRWWLARETLELLAEHAGDAESLVWIARQHLAVPPPPRGFSALNRMFTADVKLPLRAFGGVGGLVFEDIPGADGADARTVAWPGGAELTGTPRDRTMKRQLFIPGLQRVPSAVDFRPVQTVADWMAALRGGAG
ncbi:MAG: hypothetical protein IT555_01885 [Acetobacteraceae bacterium]|nr:hypothetical protein [Acetobacteraceae bacterium]